MIRALSLAAALTALVVPAASAAVVAYRFASDPISLTVPGTDDDLAGTISAVVRIDEAVSGPLADASFFASRDGPAPFTTEAGQVAAVVEASAGLVGVPSFDTNFFLDSPRFVEATLDFTTSADRELTSMRFSILSDTPDYFLGLNDVEFEVGTSIYAASGSWMLEPVPIPLPAGLPLLAAGLGALALLRRRGSAG